MSSWIAQVDSPLAWSNGINSLLVSPLFRMGVLKKNRLQLEKRNGKVIRYGNDELVFQELPNMSHVRWREDGEREKGGILSYQPVGMERYNDWVCTYDSVKSILCIVYHMVSYIIFLYTRATIFSLPFLERQCRLMLLWCHGSSLLDAGTIQRPIHGIELFRNFAIFKIYHSIMLPPC